MSDDHVRSLARGLAVIRAFGPERGELTLSDVARHTDLTRAAARRFLLTLVGLGYVRTDGKLFALTPRVLDLGYAYLSSQSLPEVAAPHLEALSAAIGESCSVSVLDGTEIVYIARHAAARIMSVRIAVGTRFPAHVTSMGRVLLAALPPADLDTILAELPPAPPTSPTRRPATSATSAASAASAASAVEIRRAVEAARTAGWALVDQELETGLRSVAAPIRDRSGSTVAAVNVSTQAGRTPLDRLRRVLLPRLLETRGAIEADLAVTTG